MGSSKLARLGLNFMSWCMEHMRERSFLSVFGGFRLSIESVFLTVSVTPVRLKLYPSHVMMGFANSHFSSFMAGFSLSSLEKTLTLIRGPRVCPWL